MGGRDALSAHLRQYPVENIANALAIPPSFANTRRSVQTAATPIQTKPAAPLPFALIPHTTTTSTARLLQPIPCYQATTVLPTNTSIPSNVKDYSPSSVTPRDSLTASPDHSNLIHCTVHHLTLLTLTRVILFSVVLFFPHRCGSSKHITTIDNNSMHGPCDY